MALLFLFGLYCLLAFWILLVWDRASHFPVELSGLARLDGQRARGRHLSLPPLLSVLPLHPAVFLLSI